MEKSTKEKVPAVLALLMGMVGMTAMTIIGYLGEGESFNPRDIATRAAIAWGVMLVLGYIVGSYSVRFLPEPPPRQTPGSKDKDADKKDGEAGEASAEKAATSKKEGALGEGQHIEETLNLLLNEPVELAAPTKNASPPPTAPGSAQGATIQAPPG